MTSLEGRVIRRRRALDAPVGVRSELWIMHELARRLDAPGRFELDPSIVFDELAAASAGGLADYSGLSHALLDTGLAAHWPFPVGSGGTPRLFTERFAHDDGLARIVPVRPAKVSESPETGEELTLTTGRLLEHYQSGTQTRRVPELDDARPEVFVQVHPATAARLGIVEGGLVEVSNRRGTLTVRARVDGDIRHDTVFLPFHYPGDASANLLTQDAVDPISGMPDFKRAVVRLRPAAGAPLPEATATGALR